MSTFLFDKTIFGPVKSRRLGNSLGINLLPNTRKVCNFNCIYCECGWNPENKVKEKLPDISEVTFLLEERLKEIKATHEPIDAITFAGNGEPTMHPDFPAIIDATVGLRNQYFPDVKIAVLSNATLLYKETIFNSLKKIDLNILKIDSAFKETCEILNNPTGRFNIQELVDNLKNFKGKLVVQTMFVKGTFKEHTFDNSTNIEVAAWLKLIREIAPEFVMVYTIERDTPANNVQKVTAKRLKEIVDLLGQHGIDASYSE